MPEGLVDEAVTSCGTTECGKGMLFQASQGVDKVVATRADDERPLPSKDGLNKLMVSWTGLWWVESTAGSQHVYSIITGDCKDVRVARITPCVDQTLAGTAEPTQSDPQPRIQSQNAVTVFIGPFGDLQTTKTYFSYGMPLDAFHALSIDSAAPSSP